MPLKNINSDQKVRAEIYIFIFGLLGYLYFCIYAYKREGVMSVIIYPHFSLLVFGVLAIINGFKKRAKLKTIKVIIGIFAIGFASLVLTFILTRPIVTHLNILNLINFPCCIVSIAAIVKGLMITQYSRKTRKLNIIIGEISFGSCIFVSNLHFLLPNDFLFFGIIFLMIILIVNILGRAVLYLSEFKLKLINLRNFRIFFYITFNNLIRVDNYGNINNLKNKTKKTKHPKPKKSEKFMEQIVMKEEIEMKFEEALKQFE
ncbi:MAG: hypothetical protein ACFE9S_00325 [Candidatus Hermodarchaeota archaeon]